MTVDWKWNPQTWRPFSVRFTEIKSRHENEKLLWPNIQSGRPIRTHRFKVNWNLESNVAQVNSFIILSFKDIPRILLSWAKSLRWFENFGIKVFRPDLSLFWRWWFFAWSFLDPWFFPGSHEFSHLVLYAWNFEHFLTFWNFIYNSYWLYHISSRWCGKFE